jgi:hypothetical protein
MSAQSDAPKQDIQIVKIKKSDFISEILNGDNKIGEYFGKDEYIDYNLEHRKYIVLNMPALTVLLLGERADPDPEALEIFRKDLIPKYDALTKDANEEVRMYCASVY